MPAQLSLAILAGCTGQPSDLSRKIRAPRIAREFYGAQIRHQDLAEGPGYLPEFPAFAHYRFGSTETVGSPKRDRVRQPVEGNKMWDMRRQGSTSPA